MKKNQYLTTLMAVVMAMTALVALSQPAMAIDEEYAVTATSINGGTNNVATGTTNTLTGPWFNWTQHDTVGLVITGKGDGALSGNIGFTLILCADTNTLTTTGPGVVTIQVPGNGTTTTVWMTNMAIGTYGYGKITQSWNTNAASFTNLVIKDVKKPIRQGYRL